MQTCERIAALRHTLLLARTQGKAVGFVPTMGALHAGHVSLLARARKDNDIVVMSLFVNPTQFNEPADFHKYPRDLARDQELAEQAGVDIVFAPEKEEMYPAECDTLITVQGLSSVLEGASRPGHFQGVGTVVAKLLNIVQPARAYFGEKDYQQLQIVRRLVSDLNIPVEIVGCPIVREADGLAMSSRNVRLTQNQRQAAVVLSRALSQIAQRVRAGEQDLAALRAQLANLIQAEPLAKLDYAVIVDRDTLQDADSVDNAIALVAARFGDIRLIDNTSLLP